MAAAACRAAYSQLPDSSLQQQGAIRDRPAQAGTAQRPACLCGADCGAPGWAQLACSATSWAASGVAPAQRRGWGAWQWTGCASG